jgi:hypothetical protein
MGHADLDSMSVQCSCHGFSLTVRHRAKLLPIVVQLPAMQHAEIVHCFVERVRAHGGLASPPLRSLRPDFFCRALLFFLDHVNEIDLDKLTIENRARERQ